MSFFVKIIKGRDTWEIACDEKTTFGDLRKEVESKAGSVEGGIRLLHKGKSFSDDVVLSSVKVGTGTKMMAMATAKQREADTNAEKARKLSKDSTDLDAMRDRIGKKPEVASTSHSAKTIIRGDELIEGQTSVLLVKGRDKFRANVSISSTVANLKVIASNLEGIEAAARDMKLLFKGKFLNDTSTLSDCSVGDGASLMLLFSARHHDAQDARVELDQIAEECTKFEQKLRSVVSRAKSRLLEGADLMVAKNEIFDTFARLQDNVQSIRGEEERCKTISERLQALEGTLEELRGYSQ